MSTMIQDISNSISSSKSKVALWIQRNAELNNDKREFLTIGGISIISTGNFPPSSKSIHRTAKDLGSSEMLSKLAENSNALIT